MKRAAKIHSTFSVFTLIDLSMESNKAAYYL